MKKLFFAILFLVLNLKVSSQNIDYARSIIDTLCSKEMYGRGYIKNGDKKAANYIESEFKKIGLETLNGEYQQKFNLDINTYEESQLVEFDGRILNLGKDFILSPNTGSGSGKTMVIDYDKFISNKKINNKAILLNNTQYKEVLKNEELKNKMMTSSIIIRQNNKKLTASLSQSNLPIPSIEVLDSNNLKIKNIQFDIKSKLISNYETQNVIGIVKGIQYPDSFLVICAHYDHLGGMGDIYFPGANDNAAGIAMLLDLAKYYKSYPHKYSVIFIAFGGEEAGLVGSKYFVDNKSVDLTKIKFLMNIDLVGTGSEGITVVNGRVFEKEFEKLVGINEENNLLPHIKSRGKAANSDHYWFTEQGVPSFFIYAMGKPRHYHDIYDNGTDLGLEKFIDIENLLNNFFNSYKIN